MVTGSPKAPTEVGNLPKEYQSRALVTHIEDSVVVLPTTKLQRRLADISIGEVLDAEVPESLIAFSDSKAPIRAIIRRGKYKGGVLMGEATLERNSKRILMTFRSVRAPKSQDLYSVSASGLDQEGILGVEGELISQATRYFWAELLLGGASGFADASVTRNTNAFGNQVDETSVNSASKKALANALAKSAENFSEKLKSVPEYAVLKGPISIQVLITDEAKQ